MIGRPPKPVAGYPSYSAAARALGVADTTVSYHMRRHGNLDRLGAGRGVAVEWQGRVYPSITAAAKAIGVTPASVWYHPERYGDLDKVGTKRGREPGFGKPVHIGGHQWSNRTSAAADLGIPYRTFCRALAGQSPRAMERILAELMRRDVRPALIGRAA